MAFPTTNLIAYYKLDNNGVDTENGYDLTNVGTTPYAAGFFNDGADFGSANSTKGFTRSGEPATTVNGGDFTINYWVKVETTTTNLDAGVEIQCTTNGNWFRAYGAYDPPNTRWIGGWHGGGFISSAATLSDGTWHMVTFTNSGGTLELFGDGVSKGTTSTHYGASLGATDAIHVAASQVASGVEQNGMVDEIGVWSSVLSGSDITALYNSGSGEPYPSATPRTIFNNFLSVSTTGDLSASERTM